MSSGENSTPRLVVMVSGSGTNLQALIDAVQTGNLQAEIALVVSNRKAAYGLVRAEEAEIPTLYFPLKPYKDAGKSRDVYDADLAEKVKTYRPDLIVLAGWMHVFSPTFLEHFLHRVINLHPSLPGAYVGKDGIQWAFDAFQRGEIPYSGCMVHYVIPEVDAGKVILTAAVPINPEDTLETFAARMHETEHQLIVEATQLALETLKAVDL